MKKTIGEKLSPVLQEIEDTLWDFEYAKPNEQPKYTKEGFRGAIKIFMSGLMDKMWDHLEGKKTPQIIRERQAREAGRGLRALVKKYTGIDSHDLYKTEKQKSKKG